MVVSFQKTNYILDGSGAITVVTKKKEKVELAQAPARAPGREANLTK